MATKTARAKRTTAKKATAKKTTTKRTRKTEPRGFSAEVTGHVGRGLTGGESRVNARTGGGRESMANADAESGEQGLDGIRGSLADEARPTTREVFGQDPQRAYTTPAEEDPRNP